MRLTDKRIFDLKHLCNKKWRVENPTGYIGQSRVGSVYEAACDMCRHAGFSSMEEADVYFKRQNEMEQKEMVAKAEIIQKEQPTWTPEQQTYIRGQLQSGLEGVEVSREMPKSALALPILILGLIAAAWLLLMGRKE